MFSKKIKNGEAETKAKLKTIHKFSILENIKKNRELKKSSEIHNKKEKDLKLLKEIEPLNPIIFHEKYIEEEEKGFSTILQIIDFKKDIETFWLANITRLNQKDITTIIDVTEIDTQEILAKLEKSISELRSRLADDKSNIVKIKAQSQIESHINLIKEIENKENIKGIEVFILVSAPTLDDLEKNVRYVESELSKMKYKTIINYNEMNIQYRNLLTPIQKKIQNKRNPFMIKSSLLADSYHYHYNSLSDPFGTYWGKTLTGGVVVFDMFEKSDVRLSYNTLFLGMMGSGKSTAQKKLLYQIMGTNGRCRAFDASGEFKELKREFNGEYIELDGSSGMINILQIFKTYEDEEKTQEGNAELNYQKHMAKVEIQLRYFMPTQGSDVIDYALSELRQVYIDKGVVNVINGVTSYLGCDNLPAEKYPILEDVSKSIEKKLSSELSSSERERAEKVNLALTKIVDSYGKIFNGITDINLDNDLIIFNTKSISGYEVNIYNAILFNALNRLKEEMLQNVIQGGKQERNITRYKRNNRRYLVTVDEAHKVINPQTDSKTMQFFTEFQREARKYYAGICFSFHNLSDVISSGNKDISHEIKKIFEMSQYKIIMKQNELSIGLMDKAFGNQLSSSEIHQLKQFEKGDAILSIADVKNIIFKIKLGSEDEKRVIATGG